MEKHEEKETEENEEEMQERKVLFNFGLVYILPTKILNTS